jgi:hypothetical protein
VKKLFTNRVFVEPDFLSTTLCHRWEERILGNLKTFGPDVEPAYGQIAAFYGMIEAGLNESYYRYAEKHNRFLLKTFPQIRGIIARAGAMILEKSGLAPDALPIVPRDRKYFLMAGFNLQLHDWKFYNIHTDTEGLLLYPASIFDPNTRAYTCVVSIKRSAQHTERRGGEFDIWKERFLAHELDEFYKLNRVDARSKDAREKVDYSPGTMVLFDSFMPHVVRPFKVRKKADRRITLVIHFNYSKHTERNPFPHLEYWY